MSDSSYAPRFDVRISGLTLAADVTRQVISLTYDNNLDMADMFSLVLRNDDNQFTDSALFDLGKTVEIHMGYSDELKPMMLGEIATIEPSFPEDGPPTMTVVGYDRSIRLRHGQAPRLPYQYMNDSAIAALIAGEAMLVPVIDPSPIFHDKPLWQSCSDFAFLKQRAKENFFDVYVRWDKLYFQFPRPQLSAVVLERGKNLSSFTPRLSSAAMAGIQEVRSYNEELAQTIVAIIPVAALSLDSIVEKLGSEAITLLATLGRRVLRDKPVSSPVSAAAIAKALLQDILEGLYEGSGSCIGVPDLRAGENVLIQGIGKRFSGSYRLKKVTHTINDQGYRTHFEVTQRGCTELLPLLRRKLTEEDPPDRSKPMVGVGVAKVVLNADPLGLGRVKVTCPWYDDVSISDWARCATPMAGMGYGVYFLPDIGDEVLVAFEHGDLDKPVVLGSLWNGIMRPPEQNFDALNRIREIKTRAGHTVRLDDTLGAEQITIQDKSGSTITLDAHGTVTIAALNVNINAKQNINMTAANVNVQLNHGGRINVT